MDLFDVALGFFIGILTAIALLIAEKYMVLPGFSDRPEYPF